MTNRSRTLASCPAELERISDSLWERWKAGKALSGAKLEVLAEASFRAAVDRGTDPRRALELLGRAHELEPSNPKHAYHIGRLCLENGVVGRAQEWLNRAAALAPTSHRIWTHLSLLLRVLDAEEPGSHEGEHGRRAAAIAAAVKDGSDEIEEQGVAGSLVRPSECRWTGVHDLGFEVGLRKRTSAGSRDKLEPELEWLAEAAARRRGGTAAFTVVAVQWMVLGYPVAAVRRLIDRLPDPDDAAFKLLETVFGLFEATEDELPQRLAECLARKEIPDALAAMVHHQRLFTRLLRFPDLVVHREAREYTGDDATEHVKAMERAAERLSKAREVSLPDAADIAEQPAMSPLERLEALESAAKSAEEAVEMTKDLCKALNAVADPAAEIARLDGDLQAVKEIAAHIDSLREDSVKELERCKKGSELPASTRGRVEECLTKFQDLKVPPMLLKNLAKKITRARASTGEVPPVPSEEALRLRSAVIELGPPSSVPSVAAASADAGRADSDQTVRLPVPGSIVAASVANGPGKRVRRAIVAAEHVLDENYAAAQATLAAYPEDLRNRHAVVLLRRFLSGVRAESEFRIGRSASARRSWTAMLADDPYHPAVLQNLAVANGSSGDLRQAAMLWDRYLESLYLEAMLSGDLRSGSLQRAAVHRALAGAFGTAPLTLATVRGQDDKKPPQGLALVLAGRAGVTAALAHLRLEELNQVLSRRDPMALLGVARSVTEERLVAAREARTRLVEAAGRDLPDRVARTFSAMAQRAIEDAFHAVTELSNRVQREQRDDDPEDERCLAWAEDRIRWKAGIRAGVLAKDADWVDCEYSGEVLAGLALVDEMALDPEDDFILRAAVRVGGRGDQAEFIKSVNRIATSAREFAIGRIVDATKSPSADTGDLVRRFPRLHRSWARNGMPEEHLKFLDDPVELYHREMASAAKLLGSAEALTDEQARVLEAAGDALRRWTALLPGSTGPARRLAQILVRLGRFTAAYEVLDVAMGEALTEAGRMAIRFTGIGIDIDSARFERAVRAARGLSEEGHRTRELAVLLVNAFDGWLYSGGRPTPEAIEDDLRHWKDGDICQARYRLVARAVVEALPETPTAEDLVPVLERLRHYTGVHEKGTHAPYYGVTLGFSLARSYREAMRKASGPSRKELDRKLKESKSSCQKFAQMLADREPTEQQRQEVQNMLDQLGLGERP